MKLKSTLSCAMVASVASITFMSGAANAQTYKIDPNHTYPSFAADHKGLSFWRGKFNKTSGSITLDRAAKTGTMQVTIDANTIDFGMEKMNAHAKSKDMFDVAQFPSISYKGTSMQFEGDKLVAVDGELTLLGVTKPVRLVVNQFKCIQDAMSKREICGADASAEIKRTDFGLDYAVQYGFAPEVRLSIQVEAAKVE